MPTLNSPITDKKETLTNSLFYAPLLKGIGQIMLQENTITGLLFLAGIFYGSFAMGVGAVLATICGTHTAKFLNFNKTETQAGLYGFSAALVGVALTLFFESVFIVWVAIVIGSILAAMLQHFFIVKKIPAFTFPFVLVTWVFLYLFQHVYPIGPPNLATESITEDFTFAFRGFGQVIFQGTLFAGIVFFIGVFISSPIAALYGIVAGLLAAMISALFSAPIESVEMGLFSYNAVLCAIAFAGDKLKDGAWVLISVSISVVISLIMFHNNLIQLTFPFVAASCISIELRKLILRLNK